MVSLSLSRSLSLSLGLACWYCLVVVVVDLVDTVWHLGIRLCRNAAATTAALDSAVGALRVLQSITQYGYVLGLMDSGLSLIAHQRAGVELGK